MRSRTISLAGALALLTGLLVAAGPAAASSGAGSEASVKNGKVTVKVTGKRWAWDRRGNLQLKGVASARVASSAASKTRSRRVTLRAAATNRKCNVLRLTLNELQLNLLGLRVDTSEINLRIQGIRRGPGAGLLGRLVCSLTRSQVRLRTAKTAGARARAKRQTVKIARQLNREMRGDSVKLMTVSSAIAPKATGSQASGATCDVLNLTLGPLRLNLLGLLVWLYGENSRSPVKVDITANREGGVLGSLFCSLSNAQVRLPITTG